MGSKSMRLGCIKVRVWVKGRRRVKATGMRGTKAKAKPNLNLKVKVMTTTITKDNVRTVTDDERVIMMIKRAGLGIIKDDNNVRMSRRDMGTIMFTTTTSTTATTTTTFARTTTTTKGLLMIMTRLGMGWADPVGVKGTTMDDVKEERIRGITTRARGRGVKRTVEGGTSAGKGIAKRTGESKPGGFLEVWSDPR
jgi:hypothetical protein